jgi:putative addiction module killer protein
MFRLQLTDVFSKWLAELRDIRAKARILARLDSARLGNLGDSKRIGGGLNEMRVDVGPGYRLYFVRRRSHVVVLLCGGDKSTQQRDIVRARSMMRELTDD